MVRAKRVLNREKMGGQKFTAKSRKHLSTRVQSSMSARSVELWLMITLYCQQYTFMN